MTTLHMGIACYEDMKARTLAVARGELKPRPDDPQVWLPSVASFAKVLSNKNLALLQVIHQERPESILALSTATGRTTGNLSRTLRTMERYGLVRLHRGPRGMVRPEVPFRDVRLKVELDPGRCPGPRDT